MTLKKLPFLLVMALSVSGCALLPRNGPDDSRILSQSADHLKSEEPTLGYEYVAVDLTNQVIPFITQDDTSSFKTFGTSATKVPSIRLGAGDVIQITVFEDQAGGLFIPEEAGVRPGNFVTLPSQEIGRDGMITVPYAGKVRAAGNSPSTVETTIKRKLEARAINPAVTVEVVEANYARASVIGSVEKSGAFTLRNSGDRILDIIAQAGGITSANHETFVTLTRGKQSAKISYEALTASPRENIFVAPGDNINVSSESKQYYTFGATGSVGKFTFTSSEVHLNDAVAQAVGLNDNQADPAHVYVYRLERKHALEAMGVDVSSFYQHDIPTVYRANFRKPDSFFMASKFSIRDGDVVYVSNADSVAIGKFLGLATNVTGSSVQLDADGTTLTR
jgi:polysaccharide export outer membrane protein